MMHSHPLLPKPEFWNMHTCTRPGVSLVFPGLLRVSAVCGPSTVTHSQLSSSRLFTDTTQLPQTAIQLSNKKHKNKNITSVDLN